MEGEVTQPTGPAPGAPAQPEPAPGAPAQNPSSSGAPAGSTGQVDLSTLPEPVQKYIGDLRQQAAGARTAAKSRAAEEARNEVLQQISQALGLSEAPTDPKALADQLSTTQQAVADAQLELTVFKRAAGLGVDGTRLLDSMSFRAAVDELPDEGFDAALEALIGKWVERDPSLRPGGAASATGRRPVENLRSGALPASQPAAVDVDAWIRNQARK